MSFTKMESVLYEKDYDASELDRNVILSCYHELLLNERDIPETGDSRICDNYMLHDLITCSDENILDLIDIAISETATIKRISKTIWYSNGWQLHSYVDCVAYVIYRVFFNLLEYILYNDFMMSDELASDFSERVYDLLR